LAQRLKKMPLGEMREMGIRGLLVYCSDYHCSHWIAISGDRWPDHIRLSDLEPAFVCQACGAKGANSGQTLKGTRPQAATSSDLRLWQTQNPPWTGGQTESITMQHGSAS
jgi:hypothetical protein